MADSNKLSDCDDPREAVGRSDQNFVDRKIDPAKLLEQLRSRVKGQDAILKDLAQLLHARMHETDRNKPLASLLFLGPYGTGKTELAKAIAGYLFKDEKSLMRFDCAELYHPELAKTRLIGSPADYQTSRGGELTLPIFANPKRVIEFDGIERAHRSLSDLFLQMLEEGRLTDQFRNKSADFTQSIVVFDSGMHADELVRVQDDAKTGFELDSAVKAILKSEIMAGSELLGLMDRVYVFRPLDTLALAEIAILQIEKLAKAYGLVVDLVDPKLILQLLAPSDKVLRFGARMLCDLVYDKFGETMAAARSRGVRSLKLVVSPDSSSPPLDRLRLVEDPGPAA